MSRVVRIALAGFAASLVAWTFPSAWCGREAGALVRGDADLALRMARGFAVDMDRGFDARAFNTGSTQFDGEWTFGSYTMAATGFGQIVLEHPELRAEMLPLMNRAIDMALTSEVRDFETRRWREDGLARDGVTENGFSPVEDRGHAVMLGYLALPVALQRFLDPNAANIALDDAMAHAAVRRLAQESTGLIESYPNERYPVDNAAVIAALGVHDLATGEDHAQVRRSWVANARARYVNRETGLLVQAVHADGSLVDEGRGSGTFLASYFLLWAETGFSKELYEAGRTALSTRLAGFGAMREYARGREGRGDIDSGPVILGLSISSTGFALGGARAHGDTATFQHPISVFRARMSGSCSISM